jgi:hypothetical protein
MIGDRSLDDALEAFGVSVGSSLLRIEIDDCEMYLRFAGSVYAHGDDDNEGVFKLTLMRDIQ